MDKIKIVSEMQKYIKAHIKDEGFCLENLYRYIGYSRRHADRIFKELLGIPPAEYIKKIILTDSAEKLADRDESVLSIALDSNFHSHEGFTRAFKSRFSLSPREYRNTQCPIPLFVQYPVTHYHILKSKEGKEMDKNSMICTVSLIEKPKRKLIFKRSKNATGYLSYCEENGCEWEGLLNSIKEKLDTAALIELPNELLKEGYSSIAAGIEVPLDYPFEIPEYEICELPEALYLYFQSEPYEHEDDFIVAINCVDKAIEKYDFARFGYKPTKEKAPSFNYGAQPENGARIAIPVEKIV